jgi:glycosyltransferase involved in cell wall biosynthesis
MNIAFFPSTFLPIVGGAEIQTHNLANILSFHRHNIDIYLLKKTKIENSKYNTLYFNRFIINLTYYINYYFNLEFFFLLKLYVNIICKKKKYDVWHFHSVNYKSFILIKILKALKQNIVVTFQGADIQIFEEIYYGSRLDKKYNAKFLEIIRLVDQFHAISLNIYDELILLGIDKKKIFLIPNCVYLKKISTLKKEYIKKKYSSKKYTLITVARAAYLKKGFDLISHILPFIVNDLDFKWIIIGRNSNLLLKEPTISKYKDKFILINEITNKEELFFPHSSLINYYLQSDLYINLARIESFGITLIEALACDLPILSFDTKGANELIKPEINGSLVPLNHFFEFGKKIIDYSKSEKNPKISIEYNNIFLKKFDLEFNATRTIDKYKLMMNSEN